LRRPLRSGLGRRASPPRGCCRKLLAYPGAPRPSFAAALPPNEPLMTVTLRKGDLRVKYFSTLFTFGTPQDITLQELRIKSFFPADAETAALLHALGRGRTQRRRHGARRVARGSLAGPVERATIELDRPWSPPDRGDAAAERYLTPATSRLRRQGLSRMRVHVLSDLHLEFGPIALAPEIRSGALAELVLLAGDIDVKQRAPRWAAATFAQPVAMIGGNHEAYGDSLFAAIAGGRAAANQASAGRDHPVRFLERETWRLDAADGTPVRIIGATLWTDYEAFGRDERQRAVAWAHSCMNDFHLIRFADRARREIRKLEPLDVVRIHEASRRFLEVELGTPFDGVTIVMTHHAPSLRSLPAERREDLLSVAYASDLEPLIERFQPALWAHGHIHASSDYRIGRTRIVCNPRGYTPDELNPAFNPALAIELG
jgi:hypothetical protein